MQSHEGEQALGAGMPITSGGEICRANHVPRGAMHFGRAHTWGSTPTTVVNCLMAGPAGNTNVAIRIHPRRYFEHDLQEYRYNRLMGLAGLDAAACTLGRRGSVAADWPHGRVDHVALEMMDGGYCVGARAAGQNS